jgi:protocatechuate 3,4-dioxygenase alpha subunit
VSTEPLVATGSQTVGPFFHFALTAQPHGRLVDRFPPGGEAIRLRISVRDGDGHPVDDAMIELRQSGVFGRLATSAEGTCEFETVRPRSDDFTSAPHIDVYLFARGLLRHLQTRIYFDGDPGLGTDPVLSLVPEARRKTLLARSDERDRSLWRFDIHLQGTEETVFFDA